MTNRVPKRWPLASGQRPLLRPGARPLTDEATGASSMRQQHPRREHSWVRQYGPHLDCRAGTGRIVSGISPVQCVRNQPGRTHRSLAAVLDWSYGLLPEIERIILRRLGVFAGEFTLGAAGAVVTDRDLTEAQVVNGIVNLVMKSLLTANLE